MSDLLQSNPRSNPYFQNRRIRRFLIRHGLINRHGDILPPVSRPKDAIDQNEDGERKRLHRSTLRSSGRAKSARQSSRDPRNRSAHRSAKPKSPEKTRCRVIMTYIGPQTTIEYDKSWFQNEGDEIVVMQQHCGGENLTVFKGFVKPQETFAFDSQRHSDYPFALALYINGLIDCRVSVCCEYKHKKNVPLGGPSGSFAISNVQRVKPCRSCRFERLKKKSKPTISLGLESGRYRRSVMPPITSGQANPSPVPSPPTSLTKGSHASDERRASIQSSGAEEKKPPLKSPGTHASIEARPSSDSRTSPPPKGKDKGSTAPPQTHIPTPQLVSRKSSSSTEDEKKPLTDSTKYGSSVVQKTYNPTLPSPPLSSKSASSSDDEDKKPAKSSVKQTKPIVSTHHSTSNDSSDASRKSSPTLEAEDKRPPISSAKFHSPAVSTGHSSRKKSPDIFRTPTPTLDAEDKRPPISSARPRPPAVSKSVISTIQNPVISQKDNNGTGNYEPDFDESNDDDDRRPSSSRYGRPRISDAHLSDKDLGGNKNQPKYSLKSPRSSDSTDDQINRKSSTILNGKNKSIDHIRKSSASSSRKSDPSEDENDQYTSIKLNGQGNVADDAERPSSRKSDPSSSDKMQSELNAKSNYDRFSPTDNLSKPKIEETRRVSSSSSEDFFGIKRSSTKEKTKTTQGLAADWFETTSKNDPDDNDQRNLDAPPKTKAWERILFSDSEN